MMTEIRLGERSSKEVIHRFIEIKITQEEADELMKLDKFIMPYDNAYQRLVLKKDVGMLFINETECLDAFVSIYLRFILR